MAVYAKRATVALALGAATTYFQHCSDTCEDEPVPGIKKGPPSHLKGAWSDLYAAIYDAEMRKPENGTLGEEEQAVLDKYKYLMNKFDNCDWSSFSPSVKTFAHRGDALNHPEHTMVAYRAAADQRAKVLECDMTGTLDNNVVCRHATKDLATTTDIVKSQFDWVQDRCTNTTTAAKPSYKCSTSDFTVAELKKLTAMMDSAENPGWAVDNRTTVSYLHHQRKYRASFHAYQGRAEDLRILTLQEYLEFALKNNMNVAPEIKDTHVLNWTTAKDFVDLNLAKIKDFMDGDGNATQQWTGNDSIILQTFDYRVAKYLTKESVKTANFEYRVQYMWDSEFPRENREKNCTKIEDGEARAGKWIFPVRDCCAQDDPNKRNTTSKKDCGDEEILNYLLNTTDGYSKVDIFALPIQRWITSSNDDKHLEFKKARTGEKLLGMKNSTAGSHLKFGTFSFDREGCWDAKTKTYLTLAPCSKGDPKDFYYEEISGISAKRNADTLVIAEWLFTEYQDLIGAFSDYPFTLAALDHCVLSKKNATATAARLRQLI